MKIDAKGDNRIYCLENSTKLPNPLTVIVYGSFHLRFGCLRVRVNHSEAFVHCGSIHKMMVPKFNKKQHETPAYIILREVFISEVTL